MGVDVASDNVPEQNLRLLRTSSWPCCWLLRLGSAAVVNRQQLFVGVEFFDGWNCYASTCVLRALHCPWRKVLFIASHNGKSYNGVSLYIVSTENG